MHYSENWGGYRLGLAEKKVGTRNSLAKKPHSIYCTSLEVDYIKFFYSSEKSFNRPTGVRAGAGTPNKYNGDSARNRDFEFYSI